MLYVARTTALLSSDGTTYPDLGGDRDTHNTGATGSVSGGRSGCPPRSGSPSSPAALVTVLIR